MQVSKVMQVMLVTTGNASNAGIVLVSKAVQVMLVITGNAGNYRL